MFAIILWGAKNFSERFVFLLINLSGFLFFPLIFTTVSQLLFQLWVGQSSEFFRRLALMLSSGREELESKPHLLAYNSVATVTASLHPSLACCLGELQRSYEFHRYFEMQQQAQNAGRASHARQKCRELNSLHTSIRSLQLHLKALLSEYDQTHTAF